MKQIICVLLVLALLLGGCGGTPSETTPASADDPVPAVTSTLRAYCFQAGKADAFLFWNDAGAVLIDTGESGFGKAGSDILERQVAYTSVNGIDIREELSRERL